MLTSAFESGEIKMNSNGFYNRWQFWQLLFSQLIGGAKLLDLTMETSNKNFNGGNFIFYWFSNRLFCETW
jgi:hypothetical protein